MPRPSLEIADIFRAHGAAWRRANAGHLSLDQLKVMDAEARQDDRVISATRGLQRSHGIGARVSSNGFSGSSESTSRMIGASSSASRRSVGSALISFASDSKSSLASPTMSSIEPVPRSYTWLIAVRMLRRLASEVSISAPSKSSRRSSIAAVS